MKIEQWPIDKLIPYENNPRKNDDAVEYVANSIKEFGFQQPIVVDSNGILIVGHTRLKAAQKLGFESVPVVVADNLTEEQVKAYRLADNKTNEFAEWDFSMLNDELGEIDWMDINMEQFGFQLDDELFGEAEEDDYTEQDAQEAPSRAQRGDIWQLGEHRLMCGDSTSETDVQSLMGGGKADMVFTDPPYNIASDSKNFAANCSNAMDKLKDSEWDKDFDIGCIFKPIENSIGKDVTVYVCTSHFLAPAIWEWMKTWAEHWLYCVWSKPNPMPSLSKRHWTWNTELICYATRGNHTFNFPSEGHALSTWTITKKNGSTGHPTEKPVEVSSMAITHSSKPNDTVLDLFGGSGSTLIACEQLGRKCYMMELDPHYCDVIIDRWESLTGKEARKLG